jgi:hypothetical protein
MMTLDIHSRDDDIEDVFEVAVFDVFEIEQK